MIKRLGINNTENQATDKSSKWLYLLLLSFILISVVWGIIKYYKGFHNALDWILVSNTDPSTIIFDNFNIGLFSFQILAENYLVKQSFISSPFTVQHEYYYGFLIVLVLGISAFQSAITRMSRYPFVFANLVFILLFSQIHLEEILLFGEKGRTYVIALIIIHLIISFLYNSFLKNVNIIVRFSSFLTLHSITGLLVWKYSGVADPFLTLIPYAMIPGIIFSIIFILITSQEAIFAILFLTTRSTIGGTGNGKHFLILGGIYLINLALLTARNIGAIRNEIALVDEYWLLIISTVIACWSLQYKQSLFGNYPIKNDGNVLFGGIGLICFSFFLVNIVVVNSPATDVLKDIISYTHLGFGLMFFCYILLNFIGGLYQNVAVYKIVYKEINFPYVTSLLAGTAVIAGLFFYTNKAAFFEAKGGYYNVHGDVQSYLGEFGLAEKYYEAAGFYGGNNYKSYHNIASYAQFDDDDLKAEEYFKKSVYREKSEFAYINLANFYQRKGNFLKAFLTLQEGILTHPNSTYIRNNLALQFAQTSVLDSALYYFSAEYYEDKWEDVSKTNSWYVYAKSNLTFDKDSINRLINDANITHTSNLIAFANLKDLPLALENVGIPQDSGLNSISFPLINNISLNKGGQNTNELDNSFKRTTPYNANDKLKHYLHYDRALIGYQAHDYNQFYRNMDLAQASGNNLEKGKYFNTIGLISLKLNAPRLAVDYFGSALKYNFAEAKVNYGLALNEANLIPDAIDYWSKLLEDESDSSQQQIAFNQLNILQLSTQEAIQSGNDAILFQYLRTYRKTLSSTDFLNTLNSIANENMKADLLTAKIRDYINLGKSSSISELYGELIKLNISAPQIKTAKNHIEIALALIENNNTKLAEVNSSATETIIKEWPFLRFNTQANDSSSLSTLYKQMGINNPFNIPTTLMATAYFKQLNDYQTAYDILLNAVEVNSYAPPLLMEYAMTSVDLNIPEFGDDVLPRIADLLSAAEYNQFEKRFIAKKNEVAARGVWSDED